MPHEWNSVDGNWLPSSRSQFLSYLLYPFFLKFIVLVPIKFEYDEFSKIVWSLWNWRQFLSQNPGEFEVGWYQKGYEVILWAWFMEVSYFIQPSWFHLNFLFKIVFYIHFTAKLSVNSISHPLSPYISLLSHHFPFPPAPLPF